MTDEYLATLASQDADALCRVASRLLSDLKEAHDRLNQNPQNSSRPSGSMPAYLGLPVRPDQNGEVANDEDEHENEKIVLEGTKPNVDQNKQQDVPADQPSEDKAKGTGKGVLHSAAEASLESARRPGKQVGAQGFGRTQIIPPRSIENHLAESCSACGAPLPPDAPFLARTGFHSVDMEENDADTYGIRVFGTLHRYGETTCGCGHRTLLMPERGDQYVTADGKVNTVLSEWRLIGPNLASFILFLAFRMRLSRARIKEFLQVWCGLHLATGTIDNCIRESALAFFPIYLQLIAQIRQEPLVHADETPWKEKKTIPWLWVFTSATTTVFVIGKREQAVALSVLTEEFVGWLMSDGLNLYRIFPNRLRCLAHLIRKAQGLYESVTWEAREFGLVALATLASVFSYLKGAYPLEQVQQWLAVFRECCELTKQIAVHEATRALAGEFLNDWDAIWKVVEHPELPATNNEGERALRHWVIARLLSHGTRTPEGSLAVAILASIIETCRKREVDPWLYVAQVIAARRRGGDPLPVPDVALLNSS